ncbi:MAG: helix-turn-helix domain-containing protein [Candidatus Thorarchaeota archaeon]|jgi:plasmid maintenance system antidote protein VapI
MFKQKLSAIDLEKSSGVHRNTISNILTGTKGVTVDTLLKVAEGLGISPTLLI